MNVLTLLAFRQKPSFVVVVENIVREQVELSSVPFASFIADRKANGEAAANSFVLRGYVRHWLNDVWSEYDRVRLMDLIDARGTLGKLRPVMSVAERA